MNVTGDRAYKMLNITITQPDEALFYIELLDNYLSSRRRAGKQVDHGALGDMNALREVGAFVWPDDFKY